MKKPALRLTVHSTHEIVDGPDVMKVYHDTDYGRNVDDWRADRIGQAKRLTDQELAAEHWRAKYSGVMAQKYGGLSDENQAKIRTVERFYLAPHYDEERGGE